MSHLEQQEKPKQQDTQAGFQIDPSVKFILFKKTSFFLKLLTAATQEIQMNGLNYNLEPEIQGSINYQHWQFSFTCDKGYFAGKKISGVLKFPPDFPDSGPQFYFDPLPNGEVIQHGSIYGNGLLCLPQLQYWNPLTDIFDILQAIECRFTNPDYATANPQFNALNEKQQQEIQENQAKLLPTFVQE